MRPARRDEALRLQRPDQRDREGGGEDRLGRHAPEEDLQIVVQGPRLRRDAGPRHDGVVGERRDPVVVSDERPDSRWARRIGHARGAGIEAGGADARRRRPARLTFRNAPPPARTRAGCRTASRPQPAPPLPASADRRSCRRDSRVPARAGSRSPPPPPPPPPPDPDIPSETLRARRAMRPGPSRPPPPETRRCPSSAARGRRRLPRHTTAHYRAVKIPPARLARSRHSTRSRLSAISWP